MIILDIPRRFNTQSDYTQADLADISDLAQDRKHWRGLAPQIEKAAEESRTRNLDATRAVSQVKLREER